MWLWKSFHLPSFLKSEKDEGSRREISSQIYMDRKSYCVPLILSPVDKITDNERDDSIQRQLSLVTPHREFVISRNEEETWAELFYDLFFVANLSAFTDFFDLKDMSALRSYISFFAILWTTWLQVSLFDARFAKDSIFERVCRGLQLAAMVGYSTLGIRLHLSHVNSYLTAFQAMSMFLFISRITLTIQYTVVWYYIRREKKHKRKFIIIENKEYRTFLPMCISNFAAAMIYLGLCFAFTDGQNTYAWIGWHVTAIAEVVAMFVMSLMGKNLSLKNTHLVHRMGLLTLIMIGEGILETTSNVGIIMTLNEWTTDTSIVTLCVIASMYFIWMVCFDGYPRARWEFGALKHLLWTAMQFPLHLWIVLFVATTSQIPVIQNVADLWQTLLIYYADNIQTAFEASQADNRVWDIVTVFADAANVTLTTAPYYVQHPDQVSQIKFPIDQFLSSIVNAPENITVDGIAPYYAYYTHALHVLLDVQLFQQFGITKEPGSSYDDLVNKLVICMRFAFISLGAVFIILAIHLLMMMRFTDKVAWFQVLLRLAWGLGLIIRPATVDAGKWANFAVSGWIAPTLLLAIIGLVAFDKIAVGLATFLYERQNDFSPPPRGSVQVLFAQNYDAQNSDQEPASDDGRSDVAPDSIV